jgi:hypothetical protein
MNQGIKRKVRVLEQRASNIVRFNGIVRTWALKYARETINAAENNIKRRFFKLYKEGTIPEPLILSIPDEEIKKRAALFSAEYPNLEACVRGEEAKREKLWAQRQPAIAALKKAIQIEERRTSNE